MALVSVWRAFGIKHLECFKKEKPTEIKPMGTRCVDYSGRQIKIVKQK